MANYVKFRRGNYDTFKALTSFEEDTLYFIYKEDEDTADLYLGSKKISGDNGVSIESLSDIKDILIENIQNKDILVYDNSKSKWVNKSIDEILADYIAISQPVVLTVDNSGNQNSHDALIEQEFINMTPKNGDIVIIRDEIIANERYQHTGYVYDGEKWIALDGNYNAENIYFDKDFIFTENIGTVVIPESGSTTVSASGKNLKEFLSSVFAQEKNPEITQPSATIKLVPTTTTYEVGTKYTPEYDITFNPGSYSYGPETGVTPTYSVTDTENSDQVLDSFNGEFNTIIIEDDTQYQIFATVSHTNGTIPLTNLQNEYSEGQIKAGELATISTSKVSGYRNGFYGTLTDKTDLTSTIIRDLKPTNKKLAVGNKFSINIPTGAMRIVFAYPASIQDASSVKDVNGMYAEIVSGFKKQTIQVEGANSYSAIDYKVFIMDYATPTTETNIYEVII